MFVLFLVRVMILLKVVWFFSRDKVRGSTRCTSTSMVRSFVSSVMLVMRIIRVWLDWYLVWVCFCVVAVFFCFWLMSCWIVVISGSNAVMICVSLVDGFFLSTTSRGLSTVRFAFC